MLHNNALVEPSAKVKLVKVMQAYLRIDDEVVDKVNNSPMACTPPGEKLRERVREREKERERNRERERERKR